MKNSATVAALAAARNHSMRWRDRISCSDTSVTKPCLCYGGVFEEIGTRIEASPENRSFGPWAPGASR